MENPGVVSATPSDLRDEPQSAYQQMEHGADQQMNDMYKDEMDDDQSLSPSIVESVMTADGIHDLTGFYIVCLVILIGDMSRGVFFPSMWPLVESMGGTTLTMGFCVSAFSFGRILVSPLFGKWSTTLGYTKTLLLSCSILVVGTLLYAQVQNVGSLAFLIFAQTVLGIGSGTLGVTRAFVADVTAQRNRTTYMAWVTAVQYAGFTVTPFIGAIFIKVFQDSELKIGLFRLNMFTAPAYFMTIVILSTLAILATHFQDRVRLSSGKSNKKKSAKRAAIDDRANQTTFIGLTIYDCCILGCMALNIATKGSISSFETLGVSVAEAQFGMESSKAGAIVASCGTIGVFALLSMGWLAQKFDDIQLICGGMVVMGIGIVSLTVLEDDGNHSWRFIVAIFLIYSIGYPIGHTAVIGLFSKIVGRRPQGTLLGWFASAGSFARVTFPVISGYISELSGVVTLFYLLSGVLITATLLTMCNKDILKFLSA